MAARVIKVRTAAARMRQQDAVALKQLVLDFAEGGSISQEAVGEIVSAIDRQTAAYEGWTFVMISPSANARVVEWLIENARRPLVAVRLWAILFEHLRRDTGEIVLTRQAMADALGVRAEEVSRIMSQLESCHVITRERHGRGVRYFMSPLAGTHLAGVARAEAQAEAAPLRLVTVTEAAEAEGRPKRA